MSTNQQNLYEVLGLPRNASRDLIEEQCIRLGEQYRPDKNSGDLRAALMFAQIERAYQTLIDPAKRAAYDAELRSEATAQGRAAFVGTVSASANSASALTGAAGGGDITLHSKINSWIAMLFLLAVFKVLSDVLSKLAASWLQTINVGALNVATVGAIAGVAMAFVGTFMVGRFLSGLIPLWLPLSGILRTRGAAEITQGKRTLATLAMLILVPVVLVGGFIVMDLQRNGTARIVSEATARIAAEKRDAEVKESNRKFVAEDSQREEATRIAAEKRDATVKDDALAKENNRKIAYYTCVLAAQKDYDMNWANACEIFARDKQVRLQNCLATQDYYDQLKWEQGCKNTYGAIDLSPQCTLPQVRADSIERLHKEAKDQCLNEANSGL